MSLYWVWLKECNFELNAGLIAFETFFICNVYKIQFILFKLNVIMTAPQRLTVKATIVGSIHRSVQKTMWIFESHHSTRLENGKWAERKRS